MKFAKPPTCFGHNLTIFRECESSYGEVATIYLPVVWRHEFICLCHVLVCSIDAPVESGGVIVLWSIVWDRYARMQSYMYDCMCSIDAPVESGGVIVLWSIVWDRYACMQSYMGLCSYVCCSVINDSLWWRCCVIIASQLFIRDPLVHGFMSCSVSLAGPYLCLLCRICVAYADCGLFVLMYLICSLNLVFIPLSVCPTYTLLHVLHMQ